MAGDPITGIDSDTPATGGLADLLLPLVQHEVDHHPQRGRLSDLEPFHVAWQHSGARTARGRWACPDGRHTTAIVKVPVGPRELFWTTALDRHDPLQPTPMVLASGSTLGPHDLGWLIEEHLASAPLGPRLTDHDARDLLAAAVAFQARAEALRPTHQAQHLPSPDWAHLLADARRATHDQTFPEHRRWQEALKRTERELHLLSARWACRPIDTWCHGDLHGGNVMRRAPQLVPGATNHTAPGTCVLIDLALVHPGSWVEDAVYLERLYWGRRCDLGNIKPVHTMAELRRQHGLPTGADFAEFAQIRRVLSAASTLPYHSRTCDEKYLVSGIQIVEAALADLT